MSRALDRFSRLVTARPYITLLVLLLITVGLAAGATRRAPPVEGASLAFLPPGSAIATAVDELDEFFGESGDLSVVTLVFRGEALTGGGLAQMDALLDGILASPGVAELLAPADPIIAPTVVIEALGGVDVASATQAEIDSVLSVPEIGGVLAAMSGSDTDGTTITIANIRLQDTGDTRVQDVERRIDELAADSAGPLRVSSLSPVVIEDEYTEAIETGMAPLIGLALLLIAALIVVFLRTFTDLVLTLTGLVFSLVWIVGAEGWLGPDGLGWIGPPSSLTTMVPIIVISLTVDYAIQAVSHYRELRAEGEAVIQAVRTGLRNVAIPLALAAVTTIASFLATLFSPISVIGDFGIVAGLGVGLSLIVMLTLVPAGRTIIDRRREARGKLKPPRPVSGAQPGIARVARVLGASVARQPAPYLIAVGAVTVAFGVAATGLHSEFSIRDILPRDGHVANDMEALDAAVGGSTELASVLVRAEVTETRTLLNVQDLSDAFADPQRRPQAAAGPMEASYVSLLRDWTHDSSEPGDKYDPELAGLFAEASAGVELDPVLMQEFLDRLGAREPALSHLLANDPGGVDAILLQFPTYTDDPAATAVLQEEIDALWPGDDRAITATSTSILSVTVTDQITSRQTEAISSTVAAALGILILFFWITLRRPTLGIIAVGPIVLVLIWILGTMALLNIPYGLITSIITALSIGIGVDYTIHVIHRYREEFSRVRNPEQAAIRTLATTGSALLGSALTTALGFGVLIFSPLAGTQQFGITAAISIAYSLLVSILVVPPAMTVWGAYENMRLRSTVQRMWDDLDVAVEEIHQRHMGEPGASDS
ncbi:MAG: MMPL family transporter [Acidimicrobiaceae bacterium]|nr:MMPL family transporter [Acidimicrobiaceae bacterium]